jgi:hypothetical protein
MQLRQIIQEARVRLDDNARDIDGLLVEPQWTDEQIKSWANEGHIEACRRTRYLVGSLKVKLKPSKGNYELPSNVISLRRAVLDNGQPLLFDSLNHFDCCSPGWETETGEPTHIITDSDVGMFTVYPTPENDITLRLSAVLEPDQLTEETDIPSRYAYGIVDWVMYRAYQSADEDKFNIEASKLHRALFDEEFGIKSSALDEIYNSRNRPFDNLDGHY